MTMTRNKSAISNQRSAILIAFLSVVSVSAGGSDGRLLDAVKAGDRVAVRAALKDPAAVNSREVDGTMPLHWAARADDAEIVRLLLRAGAPVNVVNRYGVTPLALAATNGSVTVIDELVKAGADPNTSSREGQTPLMTAARTGNPDAVRVLLDYGADPNASEQWLGETALMWAAAQNHGAAVQALVDYGADVDARSALSTIPTLTAAGIGLITMEFPKGGWTALMYAAREGAGDATRTLAAAGADLNVAGPDGVTPLMLAVINAHFDVASTLLDAGADPARADRSGMTALYAAVDMRTLPWMQGRPGSKPSGTLDDVDMVKTLLAHGADVNAKLKAPLQQRNHTAGDPGLGEGATPFMRAAKSGDVDLMTMLLEKGADPAIMLRNHTTALMIAAGLTWRDGGGAFPTRDRGTDEGAVEALELLLAHGADINAVNDAGDTAVHGAVQRGSEVLIRFRAAHGARLDVKNKQGRTPLDVASARREHAAAAALLRQLLGQTVCQPKETVC
jgi:ankyrin repeat protein